MIFQISYENLKEKIVLPVNPAELIIEGGGSAETIVNVIKGGERTMLGDEELSKVSFSSFFPKHYDSSFCETSKIPDPWEAVKQIEKWRGTGKPVKLLITETNVNMYASISAFEYKEKGGEPGDVYYSIKFTEFKFITIREVVQDNTKALKKTSTTQKQTSRPNTKADKAKYYTVVRGDCLWNIARRFYGSGSQYTKIYNANRPPIKNANLIYVGWRLKIP